MIKFGTSGWRGIIGDDFTFDNVRLVTQSIADYVKQEAKKEKVSKNSGPAVIIGYDTRFLSENFARASAGVLAANKIKVFLCKRDTPTPVIAFEIIRQNLSGGINFTASHNPYQYNGLKFSPAWGGPALPQTTKAIEDKCKVLDPANIKTVQLEEAKKEGLIKEIDPRPAYFRRLKNLVDFTAIKRSKLKIVTDMLYGTGIGYLDETLKSTGVTQKILHNWRDVMFGGNTPEPSEYNLQEMLGVIKKESYSLGLAIDGDGDRFGILDSNGAFINPNQTIALLLYHLIKTRKWNGVIARSVMTTHLIDKIAAKFGLEVKETPVGFKYIGEIMVKQGKNFIIGGEESGGLTIRGHVPEKDGVLACLLVAETAAINKKSISKILAEIEKLVGPVYSNRINYRLTYKQIEDFRLRLREKMPSEFAGIKVKDIITLDGYKFVLSDDSWLGMRFSGTEPVVRLYTETNSKEKMKKLIYHGERFIKGTIK